MNMQSDNLKQEVEIKEMECVFCSNKEQVQISEKTINEETGSFTVTGIDYWSCSCCGEEHDTKSVFTDKNFEKYLEFTEREDWLSLINSCQEEGFDGFMLISAAKFYLQKKEFRKAEKIAQILLNLEPNDFEAEELLERIKNKDNKRRIKATFNDIEGAFQFCDITSPYFLDLKEEEIIFYSDYNPMPEDEPLKEALDNDPDRFISVPHQDSNENYRLMESFIHEIGEHQGTVTLAERLAIAIQQRKPFRRFKDVLLDFPK